MGCTQGKPSMNTPPTGLDKLKMQNGYAGRREDFAPNRRSTGQRQSGRIDRPEPPMEVEFDDGGGEGKLSEGVLKRDDGAHACGNNSRRDILVVGEDELVDGWPKWLTDNIPREVLAGLVPKSAENYDKLDKVGQGTYSNVYKARDRDTGKIVALKKVRFDTSEPESVKFMAREIMILLKLDHPNVLKLEGLATSRMQYSLYLVFDFMQSDLARVISRPEGGLTEPQIKCYMHQLLSGLQHCHDRGILHRDIKGSNLLIDKNGMLKIGDLGLANYYFPNAKRPLTNRVVTLWYRAPELLLGSTDYGVGIDLWSAGCVLAEMFAGRPIMPGRTEVEQLHRIFKLCGTPSGEYWKKLRLSTTFRPPQCYKPTIFQAFRDFPESSIGLLSTLLALDPTYRGTASSALQNEFFRTSPLACDLSGLPVIYQEEDEPPQASERRKYKNSRMKQRSQRHRERRRKDIPTEKPKEDHASPKEDQERTVGSKIQSQVPRSSTSSTSSSTRPGQNENLPFLLSPMASSQQMRLPPGTQGHPNARKSFHKLPPLPTSKTITGKYKTEDDDVRRLSQVNRSASTREFREVNQRKYIQPYPLDDQAP
ncbi:Serine/threonine-protein kinase [Tripterygium wilfordii]|uniref:Serine/threonine-protein kinase n=2 Tax=Tripterygium wilfordii TaxID=458696 RepID=A0A7J7CML8_TRIWF|nr:Serine/threonine-protein kinase [Tripterygium wilfordii]